MRNTMKVFTLAALASSSALAQSPYRNITFNPVVMTATSQTSTPIQLVKQGSFSAGAITVTGTSLTTATFSVLGSQDGVNYFQLPINPVASPTSTATTQTVTAASMFNIPLVGLMYLEFQTSGTFTGTNISLLLTAAPVATVARNGGGGGTPYNPAAVDITGGTIDGTVIGATTPAAVHGAGLIAALNGVGSCVGGITFEGVRCDQNGIWLQSGQIYIYNNSNSIVLDSSGGMELYSGGATLRPHGGYRSADGTAGATVTTCTGFKNGLCISGT